MTHLKQLKIHKEEKRFPKEDYLEDLLDKEFKTVFKNFKKLQEYVKRVRRKLGMNKI